MKPTLQFIEANHRRGESQRPRKASGFPVTDCNFHVSAADFGHGHDKGGRSFHGISRDYFKREARTHFAVEAVIFGLIVLTAAVPVVEGIKGLAQFVYGVL